MSLKLKHKIMKELSQRKYQNAIIKFLNFEKSTLVVTFTKQFSSKQRPLILLNLETIQWNENPNGL